jgi:lipoyl(octanoyl) transferase
MPAVERPMLIRRLGTTDFETTWRAMQRFTEARVADTPDELWLTDHPPVYTVGVAGRDEHLPRADTGIPVIRTDRGGQVTWHGPGQIVVYVLTDLRRSGCTVRALVRTLEEAVVDVLAAHDIAASGDEARPGVYVDGAKIAALGLKVRRGCTYHGLSFNADPDLAAFEAIDPCGHPGLAVTSARNLGVTTPLEALAEALLARLVDRLVARLDARPTT